MSDPFIEIVRTICDQLGTRLERPLDAPARDRDPRVVEVLGDVLAAELACVQRYRAEHRMATELHGASAAAGFLEYVDEERYHVDLVAGRIVELGGQADFTPALISRMTPPSRHTPLEEWVAADLLAEGQIVRTYRKLSRWLRPQDPVTADLIEQILEAEEAHASA